MDKELESAIDKAGRDRVISFIKSQGWQSPPPKWVWWEAIRALPEEKKQ